ncbi:MAG: SiaB family protein kinase [SAR324 cluster bacterium]|nr:SiaB family protein kinase [SAR324 cluster bacterium]
MDLQELNSQLKDKGVIFVHSGYVSHEILSLIIEALEKKTDDMTIAGKPAQKVFTIIIEMMQNVLNYKAEKGTQGPIDAILVVGYIVKTNTLYIKCGNMIDSVDQEFIEKKIKSICHLEKDELRKKYRELRKSGEGQHSRGAGLGFLEIQRNASEPIQCKFFANGEGRSFYSLEANI